MPIPRSAAINVIKGNDDGRNGEETYDNYQNADRETSNVVFEVHCRPRPSVDRVTVCQAKARSDDAATYSDMLKQPFSSNFSSPFSGAVPLGIVSRPAIVRQRRLKLRANRGLLGAAMMVPQRGTRL